jgi:hypothetical protein
VNNLEGISGKETKDITIKMLTVSFVNNLEGISGKETKSITIKMLHLHRFI